MAQKQLQTMNIKEPMDKEEILAKIEPILKQHYEHLNNLEFIPGKSKVYIGWPVFDEKEILNVLSSLLDMRISQGPKVAEFEKRFAEYKDVKFAIAVNSGSSANFLALATFMETNEIKPGDEVIVPAATFSTVVAPIIQLDLIPVFVDSEEDTYNIDPKEIEKAIGEKTKLIMPVHTLGNPANMQLIMEIAKKNNLKVLEDFCESVGASIAGKKVGSFSDMSTASFFVAHNMTTGEGGMVLTNSTKYNKILRSLREFGRFSEEGVERFDHKDDLLGNYDLRFVFERLGFNVRITDTTAAIGLEQLKKLDDMNNERILIASHFIATLKKYEKWIQLPVPLKGYVHTYLGFPILIKKEAPFSKDEIVKFLEEKNIETRAFLGGCLPDQPGFRNKPHKIVGNLSVSRYLKEHAFYIGCHPAINKKARDYVVDMFKEFLEKY